MIMVDIDGTIAATGELLLSRYKIPLQEYPAPLPECFWTSPEGLAIFRDVKPIPGSVETLNAVSESGITYFTLRPRKADFITVRWLQKHGFPEGPVFFCKSLAEKAQMVKDIDPILVIDDDPRAPLLYNAPLVLIARLYNKGVKNKNRMSWQQILGGSACTKKPF
jgi:hypothetical protein